MFVETRQQEQLRVAEEVLGIVRASVCVFAHMLGIMQRPPDGRLAERRHWRTQQRNRAIRRKGCTHGLSQFESDMFIDGEYC